MSGFIWFLVFIWIIALLVWCCSIWYQNWMRINKAIRNQSEQYDERHKKEEKKEKNTSYNVEDEEVKKIFKELKKWETIDEVAKKLNIKKSKVYDIQIFLEDEWLL